MTSNHDPNLPPRPVPCDRKRGVNVYWANELRLFRESRGFTRAQVADALHTYQITVQRWEEGDIRGQVADERIDRMVDGIAKSYGKRQVMIDRAKRTYRSKAEADAIRAEQ